MTKTFTNDDLIRYLYGETSTNENHQIENAVLFDTELKEQLLGFKHTIDLLDRIVIVPSKNAMQKVYEYSAQF